MCGVSPPRCGDPAPHRRGIHRVQHLGRFGIGDRPAVGAEIPRGVETEIGMRGHADPVVGYRAEHDGAGRGAQAVDDDLFAGAAQALIFVDIGADPAAAIVGDPHHRLARAHPCQKRTAASNPVTNFISRPQFKLSNPNLMTSCDARPAAACCRIGFLSRCARRASNQIQIECCRHAAPWREKVPKWNTLTLTPEFPWAACRHGRPPAVDRR